MQWPSYGNNLWQDRYSPDTTLTPATVANLHPVFNVTLPGPTGGNESYPLEQGGVLYVTTMAAEVLALNATTGAVMWSYTPPKSQYKLPQINRGVTLGDGFVYVLTADDRLIALNQSNGQVVFNVQVANPADFEFESMAPQFAAGELIVGVAGGDEGVRGFAQAYDGKTGKQLWKFYTVPARGQSWMPASGDHGGGAVWTTPTVDVATHTVYIGTGNPSPDYFGKARPGANPDTDSVVALDLRTGQRKFAAQEVAHDLWDYDVASPSILFRASSNKLVVGEAGKDGEWYEWDAATGQRIISPVAFVKQAHSPPTKQGTKEWPGPDGGANYGPSAYDPISQTVFVAGIDGPETLFAEATPHSGRTVDLGTRQSTAATKDWTGTVTGINVLSGEIKWQVTTKTPPIGGVTASAGGLIWYGQANGMLTARQSETGKVAWQQQLGAPIGSAPIVYQWRGNTYVTVVTGGAASLSSLFPYNGSAHLITYEFRKS